MTRLLPLLVLSAMATQGAWIEMKAGPFTVYSDAGDKPARLALTHLEQYRHALGQSMGRQELKARWPIVVVVAKAAKNAQPAKIGFGRNGWIGTWPANAVPPSEWFVALGHIFLESNLNGRMPGNTEQALLDLFSTLDVKVTRLTLGAPPPPPRRTIDWARLHMLATLPEYSGKLRVLLGNLANGAEEDPSYRNAFEKSRADLTKEADAYLKAGQFGTFAVTGKPVDPERQYRESDADPSAAALLTADLLLAQGAPPQQVRAAYDAVLNLGENAAAQEGRGLAILAEGDKATAKMAFDFAIGGEGAGARAFLEASRLEPNWGKAEPILEKALQKNPLWGEPWAEFAKREQGPNRRATALQKAAEAEPRRVDYWREAAEALTDIKNFEGATKAWLAAERVAPNEKERQAIVQARLASEQRQLDKEAEDRRKKVQSERDEVEKLRLEALERIRKAEEKARGTNAPLAPGTKVEKWWDGPATEKVTGTLARVDCLGKQAKLHIRLPDNKVMMLLVSDPTQVLILGTGEKSFSCGIQKPARAVNTEYIAKPNPKLGTAGEAKLLEFR